LHIVGKGYISQELIVVVFTDGLMRKPPFASPSLIILSRSWNFGRICSFPRYQGQVLNASGSWKTRSKSRESFVDCASRSFVDCASRSFVDCVSCFTKLKKDFWKYKKETLLKNYYFNVPQEAVPSSNDAAQTKPVDFVSRCITGIVTAASSCFSTVKRIWMIGHLPMSKPFLTVPIAEERVQSGSCSADRLSTNPRYDNKYHLEPRMILFPPPPTQSNPPGHDYQRPDESAWTAQSHDYNTWRPTRIGRFTSDDAQVVYNDLTSWRLKQGRFSIP